MTLPCPVRWCDRVMPGHLTVCRACSAGLARDLADVPSLAADLDIARTRQARLGDGHGGGRARGLPWDERAGEASAVLRSALVGWHRALTEGVRPVSGPVCVRCDHRSCERIALVACPPADTLADLARWLLRHRARLFAHPAAPEAVDELCDAVRLARRAIDRAPDRMYAGPCAVCDRDLYARLDADQVTCPCGAEYGVAARRDWMLGEVREMLGAAPWVAAVARGLGYRVSGAAVRGMALRGRITARGRDPMGHPTYRVGDVLSVVGDKLAG